MRAAGDESVWTLLEGDGVEEGEGAEERRREVAGMYAAEWLAGRLGLGICCCCCGCCRCCVCKWAFCKLLL